LPRHLARGFDRRRRLYERRDLGGFARQDRPPAAIFAAQAAGKHAACNQGARRRIFCGLDVADDFERW
jgi:hypothetical protein